MLYKTGNLKSLISLFLGYTTLVVMSKSFVTSACIDFLPNVTMVAICLKHQLTMLFKH